jgi:peptidoglycan/xylan/chitin deacetylase (PgdA/CDA1 family)
MIDAHVGGLRRWLPSPFLRCSAGFQLVGWAAAGLAPDGLPVLVDALVANHAILLGASLWPRSPLLGPNHVRLPSEAAARGEIALTFDDGPDPEVTPKVLALLDAYRAKASFFCIAARAVAFPDLVGEIVARGHSIENHSYRHAHTFAFNGISALRREIERAQMALIELSGRRPRYFRAPAGMRNPWLQPVLSQLGLELVSWTRRGFDAVCRKPEKVQQRLLKNLEAGDILLLHDGSPAHDAQGRPVVLEVLPRVLDTIAHRGLNAVALEIR